MSKRSIRKNRHNLPSVEKEYSILDPRNPMHERYVEAWYQTMFPSGGKKIQFV